MSTPMLEQYNELKQQYPDCILLFRLGDFYEGFNQDAKTLSKVLGITLTGRGKDDSRIPMAGIPYHALKQYLPKLVKAGYKIALAEQMEPASTGKLVKRDVVKVITAGTVLDDNILEDGVNNYLVAVYLDKKSKRWGLSYADVSTGEFRLSEFVADANEPTKITRELKIEIFRLRPAELLVPASMSAEFREIFPNQVMHFVQDRDFDFDEASRQLSEHFGVTSLKGFGIDKMQVGVAVAGQLFWYLSANQKVELKHIVKLLPDDKSSSMQLDESTILSLELIMPIRGQGGRTVYQVINEAKTSMGQRLLASWLLRPLTMTKLINQRLEAVELLSEELTVLGEIRDKLANISDLERISARICTGSANARDLLFLASSTRSALEVLAIIGGLKDNEHKLTPFLCNTNSKQELKAKLLPLIDDAIHSDPPITITEGRIIKPGYHAELDEINSQAEQGKKYINSLEVDEKEKTGISSLKVKFNKVFGYYIEVSKANSSKVPDRYIRKQTLVNAERYVTEDLKYWEDKVLGAQEKAFELEYRIFEQVRQELIKFIEPLQELSQAVARVDVLSNFAYLANEYNYCKPEVVDDENLQTVIEGGRHIVVERGLGSSFVENDIHFDNQGKIIILTGPNMSGKSTYIRQTALIVILSQIGCFVPATKAIIPIVDRVFTRVGASDNLAAGESTFMVEMNETANILNNATSKSLLILDEVGRGTSTYDGVALAWSIVEYITNHIKARTLFATHYHELMQLEELFALVKNYNVQVREEEGEVLFMHKIAPGAVDRSYGIHVAKLAGVPRQVISRAEEILSELESEQIDSIGQFPLNGQLTFGQAPAVRESDTELENDLKELDINSMTPFEALGKLKELQDKVSN